MAIARTTVKSSAVISVGYDDATQQMDIEYSGGTIYRYSVPPGIHEALMASESIGRFVRTLPKGVKVEPGAGIIAGGAELMPETRRQLSIDSTPQAVAQEVNTFPAEAVSIRVTDPETLLRSAKYVELASALKKKIQSVFGPIKAKAWAAHKEVVATENAQLKQVNAIIAHNENEARAYHRTIKAEADRIEAEQRKAREEEERIARESAIDDALTDGDMETAEAIDAGVVPVYVPPAYTPAPPSAAAFSGTGINVVECWTYEITGMMVFIKAVAAGTIPIAAVQEVPQVLNSSAKSFKTALNWPGVRVFDKGSVRKRF